MKVEMENITLHHGDCLKVLKDIADNSIDSVVSDPPYGLSFMGKKWDYDVPSQEIWAECLRVLKPGGHLLAFAGTRTQHRMAVRIEDAGFEIRDMIAWVYGSGFPKSHNISKALEKNVYVQASDLQGVENKSEKWQGWGTALKPALEPITVARKPLVSTVAANVLEHGTGALNIDGCRVATDDNLNGGAYSPSIDGMSQNDVYGKYYKKPGCFSQPMGRWPANLIHDGSDEVLALTGEQARFFYCAKASKRDRDEGLEGFEEKPADSAYGDGLNTATKIRTKQQASGGVSRELRRNIHPTVKPTDLMRYLCRLVTPPSGIVLDPFMGSGSTGRAANLEGFGFIGIEREAEYVDIAKARIKAVSIDKQRDMF